MIRVQREPFDMGAEITALTQANTAGNSRIGAVVSFLGIVRQAVEIDGKPADLTAMTLEHYPQMTERQLQELETEARRRWDLETVLIIHRYGELHPGEPIVLVVTASAHREAAFEACQFLMDWLKTRAPFWKHEATTKGNHWVEAKASDDEASARWIETDLEDE